ATTLRCTIEAIEGERGERTLTILYRDVEGSYYERREIREHIGVVGFERLMPDEEEPYEVSYTVFPGATLLPPTVDFVDVTSKAWFLSYFGAPQRMELIQGYPDGTFRPDRSISVAEFVKTIVGARGYRIANEEEPWYRPYIGIAEERELVRSGEFEGYDRPIRREEMAMLLARAAGTQPVDGGDFEGFSDSDEIGSYFQSYVTQATEHGLLTGYPDGSFRPGEAMTRAEAARVLWSLIHVIDHPILRPEGTLELEEEFQDRLYQDTIRDEDDPLPRVEDFDRMEDVIDHLAEIMNRDLASSYVEDYYEERSGRLYLIPMDGPTLLREDEDFQLRMITPTQYELVQDTSTELVGDYILTIEYRRKDDRWIIFDREVTLEG
ncbi:MAG: S-layer homology domain-containing protein, partial [Bacillota bacterium]